MRVIRTKAGWLFQSTTAPNPDKGETCGSHIELVEQRSRLLTDPQVRGYLNDYYKRKGL